VTCDHKKEERYSITGKTITYSNSYIDFYADEALRINGEVIPSAFPQSDVTITYEPVGVVGIITPWNFPLAMFLRKVAPALAAGCSCVVKPDEHTPLCALLVVKLGLDAGIPAGVLNCIIGESEMVGELFCQSSNIQKISFTGSVKVGKILAQNAGKTLKRVSLELGGDAPFIVFGDADLELAAEGLIAAKFRNTGQTCVAANRLLVEKTVSKKFSKILVEKIEKLKLGSGLILGTQIAPMINRQAVINSTEICSEAIEQGAKLLSGGIAWKENNRFFLPTVLSNVSPSMKISQEELFAPIIPIIEFSSQDEAIKIANDTDYGLASYFYSENAKRIFQVKKALKFGMVGVNTGGISSALIPFGGIKNSGYGREGSSHGLMDYLNMKYVCAKH